MQKNTKTSNKDASVNEKEYFFSSNSTIQRAIHDSAHFYLKISVNFIKDKRISNDCFRMLTLLLSKTDGWKIVPKVLAKELKEYGIGFNKTYHLITEAIELGYMKRDVIKKGNLPIGNNYFVSEEPIFSNNSSAITDSVITKPVKHINNQVSIHKKDNTEKITHPKPKPKKAATAPSSPIIPLFSYSWKNKTTGDFEKIENGITQKEMEKLLEIGLNETEIRQICNEMAAWAERSNGTIRFKNANVYRKILDWKRKKDLKKEEKKQLNKEKEARKEMDYSEREQKNIPDVEGKRQDDFKAYITKVRENPKNSLICNLIRPNGGCTNAELFRINGRTLHSTLNYNEVNYKDKMAAWMKDMTQEFKERDKLKNSWG